MEDEEYIVIYGDILNSLIIKRIRHLLVSKIPITEFMQELISKIFFSKHFYSLPDSDEIQSDTDVAVNFSF